MTRTEATFADLLAGELRKAFTGKTWYVMLLVGVGLSAISVLAYASQIPQTLETGVTIEAATAETVRVWFMTILGSGLFGAVFVTREYGNHSIVRSVLLAQSRSRLFGAKLLVATLVGVLYAVVVVGLAFATVPMIDAVAGVAAVWSEESTRTVTGVAVVVVAGAPWGMVFGWLLRSSVGAVATFLAMTLVVDEGIFKIAPDVGRFAMQIAMGAVYRDGKPEMLSPGWAGVVIAAWVLLGLTAAVLVFRRRDVQ